MSVTSPMKVVGLRWLACSLANPCSPLLACLIGNAYRASALQLLTDGICMHCSHDGNEKLPATLAEALATIKIIGSSWPARHPRTPVSTL